MVAGKCMVASRGGRKLLHCGCFKRRADHDSLMCENKESRMILKICLNN